MSEVAKKEIEVVTNVKTVPVVETRRQKLKKIVVNNKIVFAAAGVGAAFVAAIAIGAAVRNPEQESAEIIEFPVLEEVN